MRKIFYFFAIMFLLQNLSVAQSTENSNSTRLSRLRLTTGAVNLFYDDQYVHFRHLFFNFNFRSSEFYQDSDSAGLRFSFEPGINGLLLFEKNITRETYTELYFFPYAKFGPEVRINRNLFIGASLGILLGYDGEMFFPFPFGGINCFYLVNLSSHLNFEVEGGFHTTIAPEKLPYLMYLSFGFSIF